MADQREEEKAIFFKVKIYENGSNQVKKKIICDSETRIDQIKEILERAKLIRKEWKLFNINGEELDNGAKFGDFQNIPFLFYGKKDAEFADGNKINLYKIQELLGEGGFGKVVKGYDRINEREVAMKFMKVVTKENEKEHKKSIKKEMNLLAKLDHPCIIKLFDSFIFEGNLVLVMEYASGGELKTYVNKNNYLEETQARYLFHQIISAVKYCHNHGIIHRDLKLENILLAKPTGLDIRIVDFGIAGISNKEKWESNVMTGSLKYMCPEVLSGESREANEGQDIWGMGCILYAMVCGYLPFGGTEAREIKNGIIRGDFQFPSTPKISYYCRKLIKGLLCLDVRRRLRTNELRGHPWMSQEKSPSSKQLVTPERVRGPGISTPGGKVTVRSLIKHPHRGGVNKYKYNIHNMENMNIQNKQNSCGNNYKEEHKQLKIQNIGANHNPLWLYESAQPTQNINKNINEELLYSMESRSVIGIKHSASYSTHKPKLLPFISRAPHSKPQCTSFSGLARLPKIIKTPNNSNPFLYTSPYKMIKPTRKIKTKFQRKREDVSRHSQLLGGNSQNLASIPKLNSLPKKGSLLKFHNFN